MAINSFHFWLFSFLLVLYLQLNLLLELNHGLYDHYLINPEVEFDFQNVLLIDDLSDTGLTLNKSIEWLKNYGPTKEYIKEVKTACLWKKKSSSFEPDFCPIKLNSDPWIVQPTEHYEELSIKEIAKRNKQD